MATLTLTTKRRRLPLAGWLWDYSYPEFLQLFRGLSEVALIMPVALRFMPWAALWPAGTTVVWLLLLILIPFYLNRALTIAGVRSGLRRIVLLAAALIAIIINLRLLLYDPPTFFSLSWLSELYTRLSESANPLGRQDFVVIVLTAVAWWRGLALAGRRTDSKDTGLRFRVAIGVIMPLVLLIGAGRSAMNYVLLFLLSSLMVMALTRAEQVEAGESAAAFPVTPGWLIRILGASAGIVFVTGILAGLLSGRQLSTIMSWFEPLWRAAQLSATVIAAILFAAARPFFLLFDWLVGLAVALANWLRANSTPVTPTPEPANGIPQVTPPPNLAVPTEGPFFDLLNWLSANGRLLAILSVIVFLGLVSYYTYRSRQQLLVSREVQGDRSLAKKGTQRQGLPGLGALDRIRRWRQYRHAASIRRIYENMLYLASSSGYPRDIVETPYEYVATLEQAWPNHRQEISRITQAYVQVRYGEIPESKAELNTIDEAWQQLRHAKPIPRPTDDKVLGEVPAQ